MCNRATKASCGLLATMLLAFGCDRGVATSASQANVTSPPSLHARPVQTTSLPDPRGERPSLAPLVERVQPAVLGLTTRTSQTREEDSRPDRRRPIPPEGLGLGSAVIFDEEGLALTNYHLVANAEEVRVATEDDREFRAEVVGVDPETDVAVIRLLDLNEPLPVAEKGNSNDLRVGDFVVAIGHPFGLELTVTSGILSAKSRVIGLGPFDEFLQTDAAINPGNSGGPLFDLDGRVVGINTAMVPGAEGIGFAIPIDLIQALLPQLLSEGRVIRGFLGVGARDLSPGLARRLGNGLEEGAVIVALEPDGPADQADLQLGDVVVAVNGRPVRDARELTIGIAERRPGETVSVEVFRNGRRQQVEVQLGERPQRPER